MASGSTPGKKKVTPKWLSDPPSQSLTRCKATETMSSRAASILCVDFDLQRPNTLSRRRTEVRYRFTLLSLGGMFIYTRR